MLHSGPYHPAGSILVTEEGPGHTNVSFTANINVFNSDLTELILTAGAAGTLIVFFRGVAWS